jgi:hypothetical protein
MFLVSSRSEVRHLVCHVSPPSFNIPSFFNCPYHLFQDVYGGRPSPPANPSFDLLSDAFSNPSRLVTELRELAVKGQAADTDITADNNNIREKVNLGCSKRYALCHRERALGN